MKHLKVELLPLIANDKNAKDIASELIEVRTFGIRMYVCMYIRAHLCCLRILYLICHMYLLPDIALYFTVMYWITSYYIILYYIIVLY